jgi:hypothetical protein
VVAVLIIVGLAIVTGTVIVTAARYQDLPDRVPIHFGIDGTANRYGPRSVLWLLVVVQLSVAVSLVLPSLTGGPRGTLVLSDCILALGLWAQIQIISAAISGTNRISIFGFWVFLIATPIICFAATRFI